MRFDDLLDTVLSADLESASGAQTAWRQLVDLIGRGRIAADARTLSVLDRIRPVVPAAVRAASARGLEGACPPAAVVRLFALDDVAVGSPMLRAARLTADEWIALLPELSPAARAVLRHRRDLDPAVMRALASFGPVDFVLGDAGVAVAAVPVRAPVPEPDPVLDGIVTIAAEPSPFVAVGAVALELPVVAEALRRGAEPPTEPAPERELFEISDVVARLEAFRRQRDDAPPPLPPAVEVHEERFRFETDAPGTIRWVEGVPRGALLGIGFARAAAPNGAGVDGIVAGAYRQRTRFRDARLMVGGAGDAGGLWLVSGVPTFDAASGRFTGYRGTGRRPRADEAPRAAAPDADSLRQLVHELRTPTNAIAGFAEMIEHQLLGPVAETYRAQAIMIREQAGDLLSAVDDLDIAARIESGALAQHPATAALAPLLGRIAAELTPLADMRGVALVLADTDAAVHADPRALERLLARLLATMLAAAGRGERIGVEAWRRGAARGGGAGGGRGMVTITVDRPAALTGAGTDALYDHDDEGTAGALLGIGFALRLVRNLARELGGMLVIGADSLTLRLPEAVDDRMEQVHLN